MDCAAASVEVYTKDMEVRLRRNTWQTKKHIIETKLLPSFGGNGTNSELCKAAGVHGHKYPKPYY